MKSKMQAPPKSLLVFSELWPQKHTVHEIREALQQGDEDVLIWDGDYGNDDDNDNDNEIDADVSAHSVAHDDEQEAKEDDATCSSSSSSSSDDDNSDSDTHVLGTVLHIFEQLERRVSWGRRGQANIEAALFCYGAFGLGRQSFEKTVKHYSESDKGQLLPSYDFLNGIASVVNNVDPLSVSMIQFALWYLVGFQKRRIEHMLQESELFSVNVPANRTSRSLSLLEFEKGVMYEQLEASEEKCCIFVSHRWQTPLHPDPDKDQTKQVMKVCKDIQDCINVILQPSTTKNIISHKPDALPVMEKEIDPRAFSFMKTVVRDEFQFAIKFFVHGQHQVRLWYDYYSIPQGVDHESRALRTKCLEEITGICQSMIFLGLISADYFTRGWCAFELIQHSGGVIDFGTKLCTSNLEARRNSPNDAAHAFLSQMYTDFHARSIYGRLCGLLEDQSHINETAVLLEDLGIRCTNGSDLRFLSQTLVAQIQETPKEETQLTWIHPFLSAIGRLLEESLVPPVLSNKRPRRCRRSELRPKYIPQVLIMFCFQWRNELRTCGVEETPEALAAKCVFKWRYPENCLDHLLETRMDFENIPDYCEQLQQATGLLGELQVALRSFPLGKTWESCKASLEATLVRTIEALLDIPGHYVLVEFSGK